MNWQLVITSAAPVIGMVCMVWIFKINNEIHNSTQQEIRLLLRHLENMLEDIQGDQPVEEDEEEAEEPVPTGRRIRG